MLNSDQEKAKQKIKSWWFSDHQAFILGGKAGTGKSFLCDAILKELPGVKPLIVSPTHEALKQIKDKISFPDAIFKTAHSSLGLAPIDSEKELKFEETKIPSLWDDVNLCIADEGSMYNKFIVKLLLSTRVKILFVGHRSQLPPIVLSKRSIFDKFESPVFEYDFPSFDLTIPQRNTGELWDFCNLVEERIYEASNTIIPTTFDITKRDLEERLKGPCAKKIFNGHTKIVLWTNEGVDRYNATFRKNFYGVDEAKTNKYLPGDKIILTQPYTNIESLEKHSEQTLLSLYPIRDTLDYFYSNSKGTVVSCEEKLVKLNKTIHIPVYKLLIECDDRLAYWYEPVYPQDHDKISTYYEHVAWSYKTDSRKKKAYKERTFIRSTFAHIKHFYAATALRLQGSTVPEVIVIASDIEKNPYKIERKKCLYVAVSRARDNLYFYRGL